MDRNSSSRPTNGQARTDAHSRDAPAATALRRVAEPGDGPRAVLARRVEKVRVNRQSVARSLSTTMPPRNVAPTVLLGGPGCRHTAGRASAVNGYLDAAPPNDPSKAECRAGAGTKPTPR